jgi:signal transduction histidine kinase
VQGVWLVDDLFSRDLFNEDPFVPVLGKKLANGYALVLALATSQPAKLQEFADYLLEASVIALLISAAMGVMLGRTLLKEVDAIRRTAKMIVHGDLSQRIPLGKRNDEFTELARQLNAMLDRIEQLVQGMREITDNVAHDLRSPLTRLKSRFELTLLEVRGPDAYRQAIVQGNDELGELLRTFESLLKIAQAESGSSPDQAESFDMAEVVTGLVELYGPVMEEQGLSLKCATPLAANGHFEMRGSRLLVAQALNNVLENAGKYTPSPGLVEVGLRATSEVIELTVRDSGPGIPPSEREHVLERFVRLGGSGSAPGNGLGLSLVRAVCHLHHATLSLSNGNPGLLVSMRFPRRLL